MKKTINRKKFLKTAALSGLGATLLSSCGFKESSDITAPNLITSKKYKWKMVTTWPPNFPVVGTGATMYADWVREMTGGRIDIKVYGGGTLVPALEVFDAVSSGAAEMGSGASYYWGGKEASLQFYTTVPFGMNAQQMNSWLYSGGGLELYEAQYARFNLVPFPGGNTGVQMAGWFNKEINTIEDFKGLKMRMPGVGGKVLEKAGGTAVLSAGSELYTNLERGVIDATEWIGPYHDYLMGFHEIAKYYYSPGWHEPGSNLEIIINKRLFDTLEPDLKAILQTAAYRLNMWTLSEFEAKNNEYLQKIITESDVEVRRLSDDILIQMRQYTKETIQELVDSDAKTKALYESYSKFQKNINEWSQYSEAAYYKMMNNG
ncbi:MAG: TRAP-type mannitol/chloroaromatic compound transport system substrate-binding protein [Saprospiraceae bacterium]|mgnify:CR=1 FL=1|jgi:TRAP-type mannitol/chloroaromatic compound transport system substrate-binding protein